MPTAIDLTNPKLTDTEANYTAEVLLAIQLLASLLDTKVYITVDISCFLLCSGDARR